MRNSEIIRHPLIEVCIGGKVIEAYPSQFTLATQTGFPPVISRLLYPADFSGGNAGDEITVSLINESKTDLYFTGVIYSANTHGKERELLLTDGYKKLLDSDFIAAYRKEQAGTILSDILDAAGVEQRAVTCPDVELARFSTRKIKVRRCIDLLIDALKEHGERGFFYFFDEKDMFHFGKAEDTGKNEGEAQAFETAVDILRKGSGWIEALPRPIRHTQAITVDGKELVTVRTDLLLSRKVSRLTLWVREAM